MVEADAHLGSCISAVSRVYMSAISQVYISAVSQVYISGVHLGRISGVYLGRISGTSRAYLAPERWEHNGPIERPRERNAISDPLARSLEVVDVLPALRDIHPRYGRDIPEICTQDIYPRYGRYDRDMYPRYIPEICTRDMYPRYGRETPSDLHV